MNRTISNLFLALILTSLPAILPAAQNYSISTEETPPYSYMENGVAKGINVDVVKLILKKLGWTDTIKILPWARAYDYIQTREKQILFSMIKSPDREKLFKFACSFNRDEVYLVRGKDSSVQITTLEDAMNYRVGVVRGWYPEQFLTQKGFTRLSPLASEKQALAMLTSGRLDLVPYNIQLMGELKDNYDIDPVQIENTGVMLFETEYCIAFSKDVTDDVVNQWEAALMEIVESGQLKEIKDHYIDNSKN